MAKALPSAVSADRNVRMASDERNPSGADDERIRVSTTGVDSEVESEGVAWTEFKKEIILFMADINEFLL